MEYTFKRLTSDSYKDLVYISKSAFNIDPGIDYYRKKNDTSKFGEPNLGFIAYSETGEPAAFYGVYAHPVILDGITYTAAQSGDTMTHKNHSGKGLFTTLAKMTYDLTKEKGIDFIFGFPNYNSYPGFVKKLNWLCPDNLIEFRDKVFTLPLAKVSKKLPFLKGLYKLYVNLIFSFYRSTDDTFNSSTLEKNCGGINRTLDFIKYKSFSGCKMISIGGIQLWVKLDGFFYVGDIEKKVNQDYEKLWKKIKKLCFFLGADTIVFQVSKGVYYDAVFSSFIKPREAYPSGYLNLSGKTDPSLYKYAFADLDTF